MVEMRQQLLLYRVLPMAERSLTSGGTSHVLKAEEKELKRDIKKNKISIEQKRKKVLKTHKNGN